LGRRGLGEGDGLGRRLMRCAVYEVLLRLMMMITAHRQTHRHTDTQKRKQYIRQFHSVHLADIIK